MGELAGVDLSRIRYPKVREFVVQHGLLTTEAFSNFSTTCYEEDLKDTYHRHIARFAVNRSVEETWNAYLNIHPKDAWSGSMVRFGVQYSDSSNQISYFDDGFDGMQVAHVLILNLRILAGLLNIAVAHKVVEIDKGLRRFKLCYMDKGASEGSQWISLHEAENDTTRVEHLTYYKSDSQFRDKFLYPRLHSKAIAEFHGNVKRFAESV